MLFDADFMTTLAMSGLFIFALQQILDFFGIDKEVYMIYLSFGAFMFLTTLVIDTKYFQLNIAQQSANTLANATSVTSTPIATPIASTPTV
jgi:hypothetical protein